jgi:hypothetical protein
MSGQRRGEVGALPRRCSLLLGGTPTVASMKGPQRLRRRGPGGCIEGSGNGSSGVEGIPERWQRHRRSPGTVAVASKRSRHGGSGDGRVRGK